MQDRIPPPDDEYMGLSAWEMVQESLPRPRGFVWGVMEHEDGTREERTLGRNIIVNSASLLIARLLKANTEPSHGIWMMALGTGEAGEDPLDPPTASVEQTTLFAEIIRKTFSQTNFVTSEGIPTTTPTNVVDFTAQFLEGEAVGILTELGLFGGDASAAPNSGTLVAYRRMRAWTKSPTSVLTLVWRIIT